MIFNEHNSNISLVPKLSLQCSSQLVNILRTYQVYQILRDFPLSVYPSFHYNSPHSCKSQINHIKKISSNLWQSQCGLHTVLHNHSHILATVITWLMTTCWHLGGECRQSAVLPSQRTPWTNSQLEHLMAGETDYTTSLGHGKHTHLH